MGGATDRKTRKAPPSKKQKAVKRSRAVKKVLATADNTGHDNSSWPPTKASKKGLKLLKETKSLPSKVVAVTASSKSLGLQSVTLGLKKAKKETLKLPKGGNFLSDNATADGASSSSHRQKLQTSSTKDPIRKQKTRPTTGRKIGKAAKTGTKYDILNSSANFKSNRLDAPEDDLEETSSDGVLQSSSLASKLTPLNVLLSLPPEANTVSPLPTAPQLKSSANSKMNGVAKFNPSLQYTSTVVTMTNNMNAIKEHSTKSKDSSPGELLDLINNIHKSGQQITNVFAAVEQKGFADVAQDAFSQISNVNDLSADGSDGQCLGGSNSGAVVGDFSRVEEVSASLSSTSCNSKISFRSSSSDIISRNSPCHGTGMHSGTAASTSTAVHNTMDILTNQQLNSYARLLWLSERGSVAKEGSKKSKVQMWGNISSREKQPYIQRARLAMSDPVLPRSSSTPPLEAEQEGMVRTRKRAKASILGKIKISKKVPEPKGVKPKGGDLVLTVTHPTIAPVLAKPAVPQTSTTLPTLLPNLAPNPQSKPADKVEAKKVKTKKGSGGYNHQIKEDYNGCQQAQRFYSMPGLVQKLYLERELFECRRLMSNSQCKTMLNDYKDEYLEVRRTFIAANNLMSSRTKKENLEIIQRSILYSKIQHHKQQALTNRVCSLPVTRTPQGHADFHSLIDHMIETGVTPPIMYPTCSPELTLVLDVLDSIPVHHAPEDRLPLAARQSESYTRILSSLVTAEQSLDNTGVVECNSGSMLTDCDIPLLLSLSDTSLDLHLDLHLDS